MPAMKMPEHFWRTTTQRRCYTPPPVLAQPPCHKMSGIWLLPPSSHLSIEPLSKTTIFGPNRVAKLLRWVYTWPQIAHLWREHPILVQMPPAPLCPTSVCCRAQKDTPTIFGEFDVSPQTVAWTRDLFIVLYFWNWVRDVLHITFLLHRWKNNCGLIKFLSALERELNTISI